RTYLHHIGWGLALLVLVFMLMEAWSANRNLATQTQQLERKISQLQSSESCVAHEVWELGTTQSFSIHQGDTERRYLVHLPDEFAADTYYPMLFFFGGKGSRDIDGAAMGFTKLPAVTVFPDSTLGIDGYYAWQGAPYSS